MVSKTLADFSKEPKATNTYTKFTVDYNGEAGDRPIAVDLDGKVIEGGCPKFN